MSAQASAHNSGVVVLAQQTEDHKEHRSRHNINIFRRNKIMARLVECIPNFSCSKEKDEAAYNALVDVAKSVPGCTLFDAQTDGNHNRCVFTMIGSPEAIEEVAFQLAKKAAEVIDMTKHVGEHSRMGATDVIPFVPTMGVTVEECVEISKRLGQRIWDELKIPSFLYEDSAGQGSDHLIDHVQRGILIVDHVHGNLGDAPVLQHEAAAAPRPLWRALWARPSPPWCAL